MTTFRILIPASYLAAYLAEPHPDAPAGLDALLTNAETVGSGRGRHAPLDVPDEFLPALADIARSHFPTWGTGRIAEARAAFTVYSQAAHRITLQERATVPAPVRPCRHCSSVDTERTTVRPPHRHNGPCLPDCTRPAVFCRGCRMLDAN